MPDRGELVITCERCGHHNVYSRQRTKEHDASYIRTEDDQWIRTYPPQSTAKPFSAPTRLRLPSYLTEGLALGTGATVILGRLGLGLPAGAWVSIWVGAVSFGTYAALWIERYRARKPRPKRTQTTVRVRMDGSGGGGGNLELGCELSQLRTFAAEVDAVGSTSETAWTGAGRPFSRTEYYTLRDELIKAGFGRWKNERHHAQGWDLTAKGRAVMRGLAPHPLHSRPRN